MIELLKTIKLNKMKKQSNNIFTAISKENVQNLTSIVKETLAAGFNMPSKTFTAAQLWNIQRQGKSRTQRRLCF